MPHAVTIKSLPAAFATMKAMQAEGLGWGEELRPLARQALTEIIEDRMHEFIDAHLLRVAERGEADRRNGTYRRRILTELGDIELSVPRTRTYSPVAVVRAYARRTSQVDRMLRVGAVDAQGRRGAAPCSRPAGVGLGGEPGSQEPGYGGGRLPSPAARQPLQGALPRRRRAVEEDRRGCRQTPGSGGSGPVARRPRRSSSIATTSTATQLLPRVPFASSKRERKRPTERPTVPRCSADRTRKAE